MELEKEEQIRFKVNRGKENKDQSRNKLSRDQKNRSINETKNLFFKKIKCKCRKFQINF